MAKTERMTGTVKWFDIRKGYGFITDADGVDCYVHFSNINMSGYRKLYAGQNVSFVTGEDEYGRATAKDVTVEEEAAAEEESKTE